MHVADFYEKILKSRMKSPPLRTPVSGEVAANR